MADRRDEDDLAYGESQVGEGQEGERGIIGDVTKKFFGGHSEGQSGGGGFFGKLHEAVHDLKEALTEKPQEEQQQEQPAQQEQQEQQSVVEGYDAIDPDAPSGRISNRFLSFAPRRQGNDIKWYVDACGYMWAVSRALEQAQESIWILDWWLSPELYLRRPPARHEQYRVDRLLLAAAERGVKVNIIVYKEVTQALTLSSSHTKHHLEDLHQNIAVFRHPDHLPDRENLQESLLQSLQNFSLTAASASSLPEDALKTIYGIHEGTVLYWAHHEKLCLVDGRIAFMGGLDLCYGRWDTNQHAIADVHPGNLDDIVFPGQDYNNARIMDFQDVVHWQNNKLDRTKNSRMGWSDVSLCVRGPVVQDLKKHFVDRWNFIYKEKYAVREDSRYCLLSMAGRVSDHPEGYDPSAQPSGGYEGRREFEGGEESDRGLAYGEEGERGLFGREGGLGHKLRERFSHEFERFEGRPGGYDRPEGAYGEQSGYEGGPSYHSGYHQGRQQAHGDVACQITRSSAQWSHGISLEHSIQNAYIEIIRNSQHFVYIENQFFITATCDDQKPLKNKIGAAIVERIARAARNGEDYKMFIVIPAIPAFAGDLKTDEALSTRAIMEFQYRSINRGHGKSIYETLASEGIDPTQYIRFFNLRNYDRINASAAMAEAEKESGVKYEEARKEHDVQYGGVYPNEPGKEEYQPYQPPPAAGNEYGGNSYNPDGGYQAYNGPATNQAYELDAGYGGSRGFGEEYQRGIPDEEGRYQQYQEGAKRVGDHQGLGSGRWDTVSECYMLGGEDIRNVPWEHGDMDEIDAFVSEELYVHTKLLIADDRIVICGSANLNDRSQVGDHDSEIAIIIEDPTPVESTMGGRPWRASKFAASLRRQLFRKHLGLLPPQDMERPTNNFEPIGTPNDYDWDTPEDRIVADPLAEQFVNLWYSRARTNTEAFAKVFHSVPYDGVRTWDQYDEYYGRFFSEKEKEDEDKDRKPSTYKWGHVVAEEFPGGVQEVKEELSRIKGTLVEMPLMFLKDEDIAKTGVQLNALTEEVYT